MNYFCSDCKYHDIDYEYDDLGEDEVEVRTCERGHKIPCDNTPCLDFKKYRAKPYKEKFSECDRCEYLLNCENVIESTIKLDKFKHFVKGMGYCQKQSGDLAEKKLSEIIQLADKLDIANNIILYLNKVIEKFGDITYGEFVKNKNYEILD